MGPTVELVRGAHGARWSGVETCASVWTCPVCSARILAGRADELAAAIDAWHAKGGQVALVTLTMRHTREHTLRESWDALSDAWAAATGRNRAARRARTAAGVIGYVRRVEVTWGARFGWHVHVHALLFLRGGEAEVGELGAAMFGAWAAVLAKAGRTPIRDSGGLDARLLDLTAARAEAARYVAKGQYESSRDAALELAGPGKLGRQGNLTPWQLLDVAELVGGQALALWREWEAASFGRRSLTWSRGLRDELELGDEPADEQLVDDQVHDVVAIWPATDWPAIRDSHGHEALLQVAAVGDVGEAFDGVWRACQIFRLPLPRPGPGVPT